MDEEYDSSGRLIRSIATTQPQNLLSAEQIQLLRNRVKIIAVSGTTAGAGSLPLGLNQLLDLNENIPRWASDLAKYLLVISAGK